MAPWWARPPSTFVRAAFAVALAIVAVLVFLAHTTWGPHYVRGKAGDLAGPLEGARRILDGQHNIYATPYAPYASKYALSYPLTASVVVLPLAPLRPQTAAALFVALGTGAAAYLLSRHRLDDLLLFASAPAVFAWAWAQWSPLLLIQGMGAATVILGIAKPQVAAVMFCFRPNWRGALLAVAVVLLTLVWSPTWPSDWLRGSFATDGEVSEHSGALLAPGGFLLLLAFIRWRDPRARLLLAMAIIPVRLWFYDQLALGFIAQTTRRRLAWVGCTWVAAAIFALSRHVTGGEGELGRKLAIVTLVYGPALFFVLRPPADSVSSSPALA